MDIEAMDTEAMDTEAMDTEAMDTKSRGSDTQECLLSFAVRSVVFTSTTGFHSLISTDYLNRAD